MAVVTVSREVGSGGDEIMKLVCDQLGYQLCDWSLLSKLGTDLGLVAPGEMFDLAAEKHHKPGTLERAFTLVPGYNAPAYNEYLGSGDYDADRSFVVLGQIMQHVYGQGNAVIQGRGSMCVLKDKPGALHVRVVAPVAKRMEYLMKRDGIGELTARDRVKEADRAQVDYIRRYFGVDIHDPTLYHFIINTGKVTYAAAASAIADATVRLLGPASK